jgi:sec-independent protein translocase protein TatB
VFNLQGSEIIIILLLALVVLGPEKLPDAMRKAGQFYAELKKMSTGFQSEFRAAVEEPLRELKETANTIRDSADFTKLQSGERPEKPKSAEMLAPADPDAVPTEDLPFQPESTDVETPPGPADQEPFSSVIVSGGPGPVPSTPSEATEPAPFSSAQKSSASVSAAPSDETDGGEPEQDRERNDAFGEVPAAAAHPRPEEAARADPDGDAEEPS